MPAEPASSSLYRHAGCARFIYTCRWMVVVDQIIHQMPGSESITDVPSRELSQLITNKYALRDMIRGAGSAT